MVSFDESKDWPSQPGSDDGAARTEIFIILVRDKSEFFSLFKLHILLNHKYH